MGLLRKFDGFAHNQRNSDQYNQLIAI